MYVRIVCVSCMYVRSVCCMSCMYVCIVYVFVYVCAYCVCCVSCMYVSIVCVCVCTLCHGPCSRYINKPKPYYKMLVQYLKHIL